MNGRKGMIAPRDTMIRKCLARHESVNSRIRMFKVLRDKHAGDLSHHPPIFRAVVSIAQLQIETGEPLADVSL